MIKYKKILKIIRNKNVELRHDVDISLTSAFRMAQFEKNLNIKSIYYLRFDSDYYNIFSETNQKIINFLMKNHEVGCHVDANNINSENELEEYLNKYNKILNFKKFTFHINSEKTKSFGNQKNFINKSIINNEYISDSKCEFNNSKILKLKSSNNCTLLIHPEWWDNKNFIFKQKTPKKMLRKSVGFNKLYKKVVKEILSK